MIERLLLALFFVPAMVTAQGTLSTQGFGYPPGAFSARVRGTGGAFAEFDAQSPVNPAALLGWQASGLYAQFAPEFRSLSGPRVTDDNTIVRFPLIAGALALGPRIIFGASATTFLDRTWGTDRTETQRVGADTVRLTESFRSRGAISDIRFGAAYGVTSSIAAGFGLHVLTGSNRLRIEQTYSDTVNFAPFQQATTIGYTGFALSGGVEWQPSRRFDFALSGRVGGRIKSYSNDSTLSRGSVPGRFGAAAKFNAGGSSISARASWEGWSGLAGLGTSGLRIEDAWDVGIGAEVRGPRVAGSVLPLRAGLRRRTLPFAAGGNTVEESTVALGLGLPLARGRVIGDVSVERASRTGVPGVSERGWTIGVGLTVRP